MQYKDYYKVMGLERGATQDDIKRAYRKLARKYHPDVSKVDDAESRFKELGEAYAVLRDAEKRAAYDELGANWKEGNEFRPPPDWGTGFEFDGSGISPGEAAAHSEFFESLFGRHMGFGQSARQQQEFRARGEDHHAKVLVDLEDTYNGATRSISLRAPEIDESGRVVTRNRTLNVNIPRGIRQGQRIRLSGQGSPGLGGGGAGDLYLEVQLRPHRLYTHEDRDVYLQLPVTPWEAELGATLKVPTPAGPVELKVPAGSKNGRKLRLKGRGIPGTPPGDFYATTEITLPAARTDAAKEFYRTMQREMNYDPRGHLEV